MAEKRKPACRKAARNPGRWLVLRWPPGISGRIPVLVTGLERAQTQPGEPLKTAAGKAGAEGQVEHR
jgi:hypothetical protein